MDVINALGSGTENVWAQMMKKTCGITPMRRLTQGLYQTSVSAEIPPDVEDMIRARENCKTNSRAYLFALAVGRQAIRQISDASSDVDMDKIGLILATTKADINEFETIVSGRQGPSPGFSNPGLMASALANELGLAGPVFAVSNACASGLVAIIQAARMIQQRDIDTVLVIGVDVLADFLLSGFSSLCALSPNPCRPYDKRRDGLSLGEGAAAVIVSRETPGLAALGTIRGWGVSNDANHITGPSPTGEGLKLALAKTLNTAKMQPNEIDYINGHGTGTLYNDEMESHAYSAVFGKLLPPVSSMKGYFGHTLGAAGVVETVLCLTAMRHNTIPCNLNFESLGVTRKINIADEHIPVDNLKNIITVKCGFGGVNAVLALSAEGRG